MRHPRPSLRLGDLPRSADTGPAGGRRRQATRAASPQAAMNQPPGKDARSLDMA